MPLPLPLPPPLPLPLPWQGLIQHHTGAHYPEPTDDVGFSQMLDVSTHSSPEH
jgi:hypothetical protein